MSKEKLTPWDAPMPSRRRQPNASARIQQIMREQIMRELNDEPQPTPLPPLKWYQLKKKWDRKYKNKTILETPFLYVWYLMLIGGQVPAFFSMKSYADAIMPAGVIGFILGAGIVTFFLRKLHEGEVDLARSRGRLEASTEMLERMQRARQERG